MRISRGSAVSRTPNPLERNQKSRHTIQDREALKTHTIAQILGLFTRRLPHRQLLHGRLPNRRVFPHHRFRWQWRLRRNRIHTRPLQFHRRLRSHRRRMCSRRTLHSPSFLRQRQPHRRTRRLLETRFLPSCSELLHSTRGSRTHSRSTRLYLFRPRHRRSPRSQVSEYSQWRSLWRRRIVGPGREYL